MLLAGLRLSNSSCFMHGEEDTSSRRWCASHGAASYRSTNWQIYYSNFYPLQCTTVHLDSISCSAQVVSPLSLSTYIKCEPAHSAELSPILATFRAICYDHQQAFHMANDRISTLLAVGTLSPNYSKQILAILLWSQWPLFCLRRRGNSHVARGQEGAFFQTGIHPLRGVLDLRVFIDEKRP